MTWWQRPWRLRSSEARLDSELRFHLEQHAADLVARGVDPDEARRQARLAIGGPEQVKEQCRDVRRSRPLEDFMRDVEYAFRTLRRRPGFATVVLLVLALGIGATTVMFTVIDGVLFRPLPYPEPDRLIAVHGSTDQLGDFWGFSKPDFDDCKAQSRSFAIGAWTYGGGTISGGGEPEYVDARQISGEIFPVSALSVLRGRAFGSDDDRPGAAPVAIISPGLWQRRYGQNPETLGRSSSTESHIQSSGSRRPASSWKAKRMSLSRSARIPKRARRTEKHASSTWWGASGPA